MSLRAEIHEAFDKLEPRNLGLEERVIASVAVDRRPQRRWSLRLRAPLSLVAVVLVIAVVAGALMGGRLIADWKRLTAPPVPAAPQTPLQKLEARHLHFQSPRSPGECPDGPYGQYGALGAGPLHVAGSAVSPQTRWGSYYENLLYADGPVAGPLLLRAEDLLKHDAVVFIDQNAAGAVVGTDVINGRDVDQHVELVIDPVEPPYSWQFTAGQPMSASPCIGWQVDGPNFTEVFYTGP